MKSLTLKIVIDPDKKKFWILDAKGRYVVQPFKLERKEKYEDMFHSLQWKIAEFVSRHA